MAEALDPNFADVLVHDILPGKTTPIASDQVINLDLDFPNTMHLAMHPDGRLVDIERIDADSPMTLVRIPATTKRVQGLSSDLISQHRKLSHGLRDGFDLKPSDDYLVMSVHTKNDKKNGENLVLGSPTDFLLQLISIISMT
jgi:hypothetical protein